ncbi:MAG: hypothetical protein ABIF77_16220 [bacterium]
MFTPRCLASLPGFPGDPVPGTSRRWLTIRRLSCLALAALCCWTSPASAQGPFALLNLGSSIQVHDARITGRGGWGMAEQDTLLPGFKNLASLAPLQGVTILLSGYAEGRDSQSDGTGRKTRRVLTPTVRAAIPLLGNRGALTAGFLGRRATEFSYTQPQTWQAGDLVVEGTEDFLRDGTQFEIPIGLAWRFSPIIAVGASVNLVRGSINETLNNFFDTDADGNGVVDYLPRSRSVNDELSGTSSTFAFLVSPFPRFQLGGSFTAAHEVEMKRHLEIGGVAAKADSSFSVQMPLAWSAGCNIRFSPRWRFGLDYDYQAYSEFSGRDDWAADMVDEWTWACGFERDRESVRRGGWSNLPIRFGAAVRQWGYKVGGNEIDELQLTFGSGFPLQRGSGHLDFAISHVWVGDLDRNGSEDRIWRVTVSVIGIEKWW